MAKPIITLTTDFGLSDWFVGTMKGVIAGIAPRARVIDLTHGVPAGDIRAGAFALAAACRYFPKGTIHVAVVDPGVGSVRKAIVVQTSDHYFIGPDNGLLSFALRDGKIRNVRALENTAYFLHLISRTFHGRDVFAPVAAHLSAGVPLKKFGPAQRNLTRLDWPEPRISRGRLNGEAVYIDRFGNAITNLEIKTLGPFQNGTCQLHTKRRYKIPVANHYQAVRPGQPVAVPGSTGYLEIAINRGSAEKRLGLKVGARLAVLARQKT